MQEGLHKLLRMPDQFLKTTQEFSKQIPVHLNSILLHRIPVTSHDKVP